MRETCIAYYSAKNSADHITDHLPFRSTRKQWTGECRRARFSERKGAEKAIFSGNCLHRSVWEQDAGCSSHLTPTKNQPKMGFYARFRLVFCLFLILRITSALLSSLLIRRGCKSDCFPADIHPSLSWTDSFASYCTKVQIRVPGPPHRIPFLSFGEDNQFSRRPAQWCLFL